MLKQSHCILPRSAWDKINIEENNEPLVDVSETDKLKLGGLKKSYKPSFKVRASLKEKIYQAAKFLPENINLVLIEGYRSLEDQQAMWDLGFKSLKEANQNWTAEQIDEKLKLIIARPTALANHHCGGAVDVTLAYTDATLLDMGSIYPDTINDFENRNVFPMFSRITREQADNRTILREAMMNASYVYYPGEWWHYCYGDRMWAVYSRRDECFYGPIK